MLEKLQKELNKDKKINLRVKINPANNRSQIKNIMSNNTIKIDIAAPPEKGKANKELIKLLSKKFFVNKNNIRIISGKTNKLKLIQITK